jgi:hypothetical protein
MPRNLRAWGLDLLIRYIFLTKKKKTTASRIRNGVSMSIRTSQPGVMSFLLPTIPQKVEKMAINAQKRFNPIKKT